MALALILFRSLPSEIAPLEEKGRLSITVTAQEGATFDYMDALINRMIPFIDREAPEAVAIISQTSPGGGTGGINRGTLQLVLSESDKRKRTQGEIASALTRKLKQFSDVRVSVTQEQTIGGRRSGDPVQFIIQSPDFSKLREKLPVLLDRAAKEPALQNLDVNLKFTKPEINLEIDRDKARALGVSALDHRPQRPGQGLRGSSSTLLFAFLLALVLIYMVLAAQFESFRDPFIVMLTVSLAFAGALLTLWYFRQTLNIFSQIGIIMLIGLVTKNGILIAEFVNHKRGEGLPLREAILAGAISRFRPILMTSFATALGALPIALALGAGARPGRHAARAASKGNGFYQPLRLKNCTARSCFSAAARVLNVPRLRRLPVLTSFFREYKRYPPAGNLRIILSSFSFPEYRFLSGGWNATLQET